MQNDIADTIADGPHLDPPRIDPAVRKAEIDYVLTAANAALPRTALEMLGALTFAPASADDDQAYFAQVRSEPIGKSGCEFRYDIPAHGTGDGDLDNLTSNLVEAAVRSAMFLPNLSEWAALTRSLAEEAISSACGGIAPMRIVGLGYTPDHSCGKIIATIDVETLGCDLRTGVERVTAREIEDLETRLAKLAETHLVRQKKLAEAKVAGTSGWVDDAALRIIDIAGFDRSEILSALAARPDIEFSFGGDDGYAMRGALFWVNGVIHGYAERRQPGGTFRLDGQNLTIGSEGLPATVIAGLTGRRLRDVVDVELIPESALIVEFSETSNALHIQLEIGRCTVEEASATPGHDARPVAA